MLYFRCSKYGIYFSALHKVKPKSSGNLNRLMNQFIHKVIQCFLEPIKHFQQFSKIIPAGNILFPINVFCSFFEEIILHFFKLLCSTFHILFLFVFFFFYILCIYISCSLMYNSSQGTIYSSLKGSLITALEKLDERK